MIRRRMKVERLFTGTAIHPVGDMGGIYDRKPSETSFVCVGIEHTTGALQFWSSSMKLWPSPQSR